MGILALLLSLSVGVTSAAPPIAAREAAILPSCLPPFKVTTYGPAPQVARQREVCSG
jgi:hypothetical protein